MRAHSLRAALSLAICVCKRLCMGGSCRRLCVICVHRRRVWLVWRVVWRDKERVCMLGDNIVHYHTPTLHNTHHNAYHNTLCNTPQYTTPHQAHLLVKVHSYSKEKRKPGCKLVHCQPCFLCTPYILQPICYSERKLQYWRCPCFLCGSVMVSVCESVGVCMCVWGGGGG